MVTNDSVYHSQNKHVMTWMRWWRWWLLCTMRRPKSRSLFYIKPAHSNNSPNIDISLHSVFVRPDRGPNSRSSLLRDERVSPLYDYLQVKNIHRMQYKLNGKNKEYLNIRTVPKSNRKIIETEAKSIPLEHIYNSSFDL